MTTPTTPLRICHTPYCCKNPYTHNRTDPLPRHIKQTAWRGRKIFLAMKKSQPPAIKNHDSNKILQKHKK